VKAFHEHAGECSRISRAPPAWGILEELRKRPIGPLGVEMTHDGVQSGPEVVETRQSSAARAPSLTLDRVQKETCIVSELE
jgi:hypothetical protein